MTYKKYEYCDKPGRYFHLIRLSQWNELFIEKIAVFGGRCDEFPLQVSSLNYDNYCAEVTKSEQKVLLPAPDFQDDCASSEADYVEGYSIDFFPEGDYDSDTPYGWIKYLEDTNEIEIKPLDAVWDLYAGGVLNIEVRVTPNYNSDLR